MDRGACSLIGLDKAIFDQQMPRYEMCLCLLLLAAVTAAGWVETAQAQAQGEAGLTVGFREVRMDRPGQGANKRTADGGRACEA